MITLLHNARCSKSREALKILTKAGKKFVVREYLKNTLDYGELLVLQEKLWLKAIEFTRMKEDEFEQNNLTKDSTDEQILKTMKRFPKLMERAIVYDDNKAFICRPVEDVLKIFRK